MGRMKSTRALLASGDLSRRRALKTIAAVMLPAGIAQSPLARAEVPMDQMWGDAKVKGGIEKTDRAALFRDGNYGMFIQIGRAHV